AAVGFLDYSTMYGSYNRRHRPGHPRDEHGCGPKRTHSDIFSPRSRCGGNPPGHGVAIEDDRRGTRDRRTYSRGISDPSTTERTIHERLASPRLRDVVPENFDCGLQS